MTAKYKKGGAKGQGTINKAAQRQLDALEPPKPKKPKKPKK